VSSDVERMGWRGGFEGRVGKVEIEVMGRCGRWCR
jgi:hypothetical protein